MKGDSMEMFGLRTGQAVKHAFGERGTVIGFGTPPFPNNATDVVFWRKDGRAGADSISWSPARSLTPSRDILCEGYRNGHPLYKVDEYVVGESYRHVHDGVDTEYKYVGMVDNSHTFRVGGNVKLWVWGAGGLSPFEYIGSLHAQ